MHRCCRILGFGDSGVLKRKQAYKAISVSLKQKKKHQPTLNENTQNSPEIFLRMEYKITARVRDCFYFAQRWRWLRWKQWYIAEFKVKRGLRMVDVWKHSVKNTNSGNCSTITRTSVFMKKNQQQQSKRKGKLSRRPKQLAKFQHRAQRISIMLFWHQNVFTFKYGQSHNR